MFQPDSRPEGRVVTGLPTACYGVDHPDDYMRDIAPEMLWATPHDPFKADVYRLGKILLFEFHFGPAFFKEGGQAA